jgi:hypothetical protein
MVAARNGITHGIDSAAMVLPTGHPAERERNVTPIVAELVTSGHLQLEQAQ